MRANMLLCLVGLLACEPMEPCPTGDDLSAWQLHTNISVRNVDIPLDGCRRQPELRAEMLPGGRVSVSKAFTLSSASTVRLDSGAPAAPCFVVNLRLDAEAVATTSARFSTKAGPHVAEISVEVPADGRSCAARMEPRMEVSQ